MLLKSHGDNSTPETNSTDEEIQLLMNIFENLGTEDDKPAAKPKLYMATLIEIAFKIERTEYINNFIIKSFKRLSNQSIGFRFKVYFKTSGLY